MLTNIKTESIDRSLSSDEHFPLEIEELLMAPYGENYVDHCVYETTQLLGQMHSTDSVVRQMKWEYECAFVEDKDTGLL